MKKMKKINAVIFTAVLVFFGITLAQETVTITTYYPSPDGYFNELESNTMVVHPSRAMPNNGELAWGNQRGLLSSSQGSSIELGGSGTPYIDFSNDTTSDYDARISLSPTGTSLRWVVNNRVQIRIRNDSQRGAIAIRCLYYHNETNGRVCSANLRVIPP